MRRSTDRILTTHVGALQRPATLSKALAEQGQWTPEVLTELRAGVADVVRRQLATGIDVVDDGEFGKTMWTQYVVDRLDGVGSRDPSAVSEPRMKGRDREQFPDFYAWADANATPSGTWRTRTSSARWPGSRLPAPLTCCFGPQLPSGLRVPALMGRENALNHINQEG